ncbi:MAG TPA: Ldh family oxidoreductase [Planctomycetota bacterium]|nr:Ldh family oxidoreductase [Planctomycetota bacterium]HRR81849.1 Ldh family oxidoreductase [Planctomycetota bacterium]
MSCPDIKGRTPGASGWTRFPRQFLLDFAIEFLVKRGVRADRAACLAETAVATEAFGIHTHGLVLIPYWDKFIGDRIDPCAEPRVVKERPATALIDGAGGFGQLALALARDLAADKARECGVATVAGTNLSWLAALGPQILPLSRSGLFAQLWVQNNTCKDCAPWGGIDARFSTNPVALTFPTGALPMLSDFSSAALSMGKVRAMIRRGESAPENLFMDQEGHPTRDPRVVPDGGTIFHLGGERYGYRGYALSLWAEALTAMAGGSANNPDVPDRQTFCLTVTDPEAFAGGDYYYREMARFVAHLKSSRLRPGFDAVRLPGERAQRAAEEAETHGILVEGRLVELLNETAKRNGLAPLTSGDTT